MNDHQQTVVKIYEAFGTGNVPFILEQLAPDVQWESWDDWTPHRAGVPWLASKSGPEGALGFFQIIGTWQISDFRVLSLLADEHNVGAEVVIDVTLPSGAQFRDEEFHLWTFNTEGKVSRFRHYVDTAKHIAAAT